MIHKCIEFRVFISETTRPIHTLQKAMTKHSFIAESEKSKTDFWFLDKSYLQKSAIQQFSNSAINLLFVKLITIRIS